MGGRQERQGEGRRETRDEGGGEGRGREEKNFNPYLMAHKNLTQTGP